MYYYFLNLQECKNRIVSALRKILYIKLSIYNLKSVAGILNIFVMHVHRSLGRFDEAVIEERRQSSLKLLQFIILYSQMLCHKSFQSFIEVSKGGRKWRARGRGVGCLW